jgi:hypothetical protein
VPVVQNETGGGKFCQHCGTPLAAAPAQQKFCGNCGTPLPGRDVLRRVRHPGRLTPA